MLALSTGCGKGAPDSGGHASEGIHWGWIQEAIGTMPNIGPTELIIILGIVLLLFGARKLPDLARSLGRSQREFKKGLQDADEAEPPKDTPATKKPEEAGGSPTPP